MKIHDCYVGELLKNFYKIKSTSFEIFNFHPRGGNVHFDYLSFSGYWSMIILQFALNKRSSKRATEQALDTENIATLVSW